MARKSVSTSNELENALAAIAEEMNLSLHELAGRLLENCQKVETLMMLHIVRVGPKKTLDELERKTFGQLLQKFTAKCKDAEAIEFLEGLLELRNDLAHEFFRNTHAWVNQIHPGMERLQHKLVRKGLRLSELCASRLEKLLAET